MTDTSETVQVLMANMRETSELLLEFQTGRIKSDITTSEFLLQKEREWVRGGSTPLTPGQRLTVAIFDDGSRYFFIDLEEETR